MSPLSSTHVPAVHTYPPSHSAVSEHVWCTPSSPAPVTASSPSSAEVVVDDFLPLCVCVDDDEWLCAPPEWLCVDVAVWLCECVVVVAVVVAASSPSSAVAVAVAIAASSPSSAAVVVVVVDDDDLVWLCVCDDEPPPDDDFFDECECEELWDETASSSPERWSEPPM